MPRIKDVLQQRDMQWAEPHYSVEEVARTMAERNLGAILILENRQLRGIFSECDMMRRVIAAERDPVHTRVCEVMSTELITIEETARVEEALELMKRVSRHHLPVMRGQEVTGLISMRDLVQFELEEKTEEVEQMRAYIQSA